MLGAQKNISKENWWRYFTFVSCECIIYKCFEDKWHILLFYTCANIIILLISFLIIMLLLYYLQYIFLIYCDSKSAIPFFHKPFKKGKVRWGGGQLPSCEHNIENKLWKNALRCSSANLSIKVLRVRHYLIPFEHHLASMYRGRSRIAYALSNCLYSNHYSSHANNKLGQATSLAERTYPIDDLAHIVRFGKCCIVKKYDNWIWPFLLY